MADYTHYPIFQVNAVEPNILVILDNSGSMNFNAYGSWPGNGGIVTDAPYLGEPYGAEAQWAVSQASDDAEENGGHTYDHYDLDICPNYTVGIRFQNLAIPKGANIISAHIKFMSSYPSEGTNSEATNITFHAESADDATTFQIESYDYDISTRANTTASVIWEAINPWTTDTSYESPDLSTIVQEIVSRDGWSSGNDIVFKVTATKGYREAKAYPSGPTLYVQYLPGEWVSYYGYFNPEYFYYCSSNVFYHKYKKVGYVGDPASGGYWSVTDLSGNPHNLIDSEIVSSGLWDGNWLNWVCMRRVDVLRKVLMGGLATSRTGGGNQVNYGETPAQSERTFIKRFDSSNFSAVSPYDGDYYYGIGGGYIHADSDSNPFSGYLGRFTIAIQKESIYEPGDFHVYDSGENLAGVLQKVGSKARWGNEWFNSGTGKGGSGGYIANTIGTNVVSLVNDIQNTACNTWTPLAEAYYVAMQYFKQEDVQAGLDYPNNVVPNDNVGQDPFYVDGAYIHCADCFVILLTDGASTKDAMVPDSINGIALKDYDGDSAENGNCAESTGTNCDYPDGGTDYLDDIALYARTQDLRADLDGRQNLILYTIYAFGDDADAENLLRNAAKNGGFEDRNGNNLPDLQDEWDNDEDGSPDTFYKANDGYQLEAKLIRAINDILARAASGTAVSVLSTTGEGEGNIYQAYFRPVVPVSLTEEVDWIGYLQAIWVDSLGNLREDTVQDRILDVAEDKVVTYFLDISGDTKIKRFEVSEATPYPDIASDPYEVVKLEEINPIWEAGSCLAQRDPDGSFKRKIFTYLDKDKDGVVDEITYDPYDAQGEVVEFHTNCAAAIKPYLGVKDGVTWSYLGATHDDRVLNLTSYIRGNDISGLRRRTIEGSVWKLGDIVYSTPVAVSKPPDNFHVIYGDESYRDYWEANRNRETIIYVGANDGMLHAFTSWDYDEATGQYTKPSGAPASEQIGDELWAYIPQSLLPHLKWLPSPDYTHVDYVDLKPKVFDAKIDHDNNPATAREWRTILIAGLNMGGKYIWAEGDFDDGSGVSVTETREFYPSYVCIDVTDPRNPKLLWERSYTDLQLSASVPAAIRVKDKWFAVFGSGPTDYDGTSVKNGHIFVVDLETGSPYRNGANDWLFETAEAKAFMNSPVSFDKNLNFIVDGIYIGETYLSGSWKGKLYKVTVPATDILGNYDPSDVNNYVDDPLDASYPWTLSALFNATRPVTAPVALSLDDFDNAWIYVGSGRYLSTDDKVNTDSQYICGVKDPFFNRDHTSLGLYGTDYYHNYSSSLELEITDLLDANEYTIIQGGQEVYDSSGNLLGSFNDLLDLARTKNGWVRALDSAGERVVNKSSLLGGILFTPSFLPDDDVCGFGGDSYLYGLYYETGTPYKQKAFGNGTDTITISGQEFTQVLSRIDLGSGKASSVGIHVGNEGAKSLIQQSTGAIVTEALSPAFVLKSGLRSWIQR
jgi:type IV pilus assembly protein PilY1